MKIMRLFPSLITRTHGKENSVNCSAGDTELFEF